MKLSPFSKSPERANDNSPGQRPGNANKKSQPSPERAPGYATLSPLQGFCLCGSITRGVAALCPWLFSPAPSGLNCLCRELSVFDFARQAQRNERFQQTFYRVGAASDKCFGQLVGGDGAFVNVSVRFGIVLRRLRFGHAQNFAQFIQKRLAIGALGCAGLLPACDEVRDAESGFGHETAPKTTLPRFM